MSRFKLTTPLITSNGLLVSLHSNTYLRKHMDGTSHRSCRIILFSPTYNSKWCSFIFKCFVCGLNLCTFTKFYCCRVVLKQFEVRFCIFFTQFVTLSSPNYFISLITSMALRSSYDNLLYQLYIEDKSNSVCSCDLCSSGHLAYIIIYPCLDILVSVSSVSFESQLPEKYTSTCTSIYFPLNGPIMVLLPCIPFR